MAGLTLDTGALIAVERRQRRVLQILERAKRDRLIPVVPAQVLAQYWRGGSGQQATVASLLRGCRIETLTEDRAREAGNLLGRSRTNDETDAVVALIAHEQGAVATSDRDDLILLLSHLRSPATVLDV
jgi:predicted nucleic acid-binding protein